MPFKFSIFDADKPIKRSLRHLILSGAFFHRSQKSFIKVTTKIRDSPHTETNSTGLIANRRYTSAQIVQSLIPSST